ncbi:hypothetical protein R1flu_008930 [Riccia fluitans]|uniref:Uncharacterized protein n=1 Tax=Riccia fluitans TaxID=41844 RepID=A0ABD1Z1G1_9MARC
MFSVSRRVKYAWKECKVPLDFLLNVHSSFLTGKHSSSRRRTAHMRLKAVYTGIIVGKLVACCPCFIWAAIDRRAAIDFGGGGYCKKGGGIYDSRQKTRKRLNREI